jgi:hypothetical protein
MKPIWRSKTFWVNVLGAGAGLLNGPLGADVPPETLAVIVAALNIAVRFVTSDGVSLTGR